MVAALIGVFMTSSVAAAEIYNCGGVFTNKPGKGCSRMKLKDNLSIIGTSGGSVSSSSSGTSSRGNASPLSNKSNKSTVQNASRRNYPTESKVENVARSNGRLTILLEEEKREKAALQQAQTALNAAGKNSPNRQNLQNSVIDRQKNIEAIQKEIARAK